MLESLRENREIVDKEIHKDEEEKTEIETKMAALNQELGVVNGTLLRSSLPSHALLPPDSLNKKYATREEFDKTIGETEGAFMKVRRSRSLVALLIRVVLLRAALLCRF